MIINVKNKDIVKRCDYTIARLYLARDVEGVSLRGCERITYEHTSTGIEYDGK